MNASEYQKQAARTLIDAPERPLTDLEHMIVWNAVGLAGEAVEAMLVTGPSPSIGLVECAGRILELVKKGIFHGHGLDRDAVRVHLRTLLKDAERTAAWPVTFPGDRDKELGDLLWYAAALCTKLGIDMGELLPDSAPLSGVFATNIAKLRQRFPNGWDAEDSRLRRDEATV